MTGSLTSWGLPSDLLVWQALFLTLLSLVVGVIAGAVGLALGTVRLPFLLFFGMPAPIAAGTNILVSTLGALTGAYRHLRERRVDFCVVAVQGVPAVVGAFIGGFGAGWVNEGLLIFFAGLLVFWQGLELWVRTAREPAKAAEPQPPQFDREGGRLSRWSAGQLCAETVAGFAIGLLGGAVGLVLNTLRLPVLIRILDLDPRIAAGSNLVIGFLMGGFGWIGHVARGQVDYPILILMAASGMAGTYYGAWLTGKMSVRALLYLMGVVLVVVGFLLVRNGLSRF